MWLFVCSWLGKLSHEEIKLRSALALLMDLKNHRQRLPQRDGRQRSQKLGVFRFVPFGSETVRRPDKKSVTLDLERLRRFQPCLERLLRHLLARPIEQTRPSFLCGEGHDRFAGVENSRSAKLCVPQVIRNAALLP